MNHKIFKIILAIFILIGIGFAWFMLFMMYAIAANPTTTSAVLKLAVLPLLVGVPLVVAIFATGEKKQKKRIYLVISSVVLPALSYFVLFFGDISKSFLAKRNQTETIEKYRAALLAADQEPIRAFLTCLEAQQYEQIDCAETLKTVSDAKICRELCKFRHHYCSTPFEVSLTLSCAKIMVSKVDPHFPKDVCKDAGLMNVSTGSSFFQGHYKSCLNFPVNGDSQLRTLGDLLSIETRMIPDHTKTPLRE